MRVVVKLGTGILTKRNGSVLDRDQFRRLCADLSAAAAAGNECIVVSSGAVGAGVRALGLRERPDDLASKQACAAVGQTKLMQLYETMFAEHGLDVAQLLLTHGDLDSRTRYRNAKNTLNRLLATRHIIPIVNENDSVATEEIRFGDNDRLSAEVAMLARADLLVILTSRDGLLDDRNRTVPEVRDLDDAARFVHDEQGRFSVGGMRSKLQATRLAVEAGIPVVIASGRRSGRVLDAVRGKRRGTYFHPRP